MKAEPSRVIPLKLTENLELLIVASASKKTLAVALLQEIQELRLLQQINNLSTGKAEFAFATRSVAVSRHSPPPTRF